MEEKLKQSLNNKSHELELKNDIISNLEKQIADSGKIEDLKETFLSSLTMMKKEQRSTNDLKLTGAVKAELSELKKAIEQMKQDQIMTGITRQQSMMRHFSGTNRRTTMRGQLDVLATI